MHPLWIVVRLLVIPGILFIMLGESGFSQGSKADYARADNLRKRTRNKVIGGGLQVAWSAREDFLVFLRNGPKTSAELVRLEVKTGRRKPAFARKKLAKLCGSKPDRMGLINFTLTGDDTLWLLLNTRGKIQIVKVPPKGSMTLVDRASTHPFLAKPAPGTSRVRSGKSRIRMSIIFINQSGVKVKVFWVTDRRERKPYGTIKAGATKLLGTFAGHAWLFTDEKDQPLCAHLADQNKPVAIIRRTGVAGKKGRKRADPWVSPNGRYRAFIRDHNLHLRHLKTKQESPLSTDGIPTNGYTGPPLWSPDSTRLVSIQQKAGDTRRVHLIESTPKEQLQPKLHFYNYLKPGDRIRLKKPRLFDITNRRQIPVKDRLFPNPWSLGRYHWSPDSGEFFFLYNQRGHQVLRVVAIDAKNGTTRTIVEDRSPTFLDYSRKLFCKHLDETNELLWMSERDGWNHIYLLDRKTGKVKCQVTRGKWVVRSVERVDEKGRQLLLQVLGVHPEQDPYYRHFARVNFDGSRFTLLTHGNGTHDLQFSPQRNHFIATYSRVDLPPVKELRRAKEGKLIAELSRTDMTPLLATGWNLPEPFRAKGRDGKTDIHGVIYRPTKLDPSRKYPVIEAIYAGPHDQHVPKGFSAFRYPQALAELGFITVQIDGMGTNWRSKAFHDLCWRNLADAGFPDRKAWLQAAARKYPYIDITRVGIYGGSAGGQNAMRALIDHHDFYDVAVADCGCHDNRMDKIWWNELWMGWPLDKAAYTESSNAAQAHKLQGKLLLTVGELDRNVDPASTMQVVAKLIASNKDFDLIVFPGRGHGAGGSTYGRRRMCDFFVRHLYGNEPRH